MSETLLETSAAVSGLGRPVRPSFISGCEMPRVSAATSGSEIAQSGQVLVVERDRKPATSMTPAITISVPTRI